MKLLCKFLGCLPEFILKLLSRSPVRRGSSSKKLGMGLRMLREQLVQVLRLQPLGKLAIIICHNDIL